MPLIAIKPKETVSARVLSPIAAPATGPLSRWSTAREQDLDSSQAGKIAASQGQDHTPEKSTVTAPHFEPMPGTAQRAGPLQSDSPPRSSTANQSKAGPSQRPQAIVGGRAGRARETPPRLGLLSAYNPASWHHPKGVNKVIRRLLPRFPDVAGMLFHTFTLDHNLFSGPASAFEVARKRIRKVYARLREGATWEGKSYQFDEPYCVKVEFHEDEDGWPHFHCIQLTRRYLPGELLAHLWKLGWVYAERIKKGDFDYLFNYVTKGSGYPEWILTRRRLRIFQSSHGFLKPADKPEEPKSEGSLKPKTQRASYTIGERLQRWERTALLHGNDGRYRTVLLNQPYQQTFDEQIHVVSEENRYLGLGLIKINQPADLIQWNPVIQRT